MGFALTGRKMWVMLSPEEERESAQGASNETLLPWHQRHPQVGPFRRNGRRGREADASPNCLSQPDAELLRPRLTVEHEPAQPVKTAPDSDWRRLPAATGNHQRGSTEAYKCERGRLRHWNVIVSDVTSSQSEPGVRARSELKVRR